jgi:hypothetical protein
MKIFRLYKIFLPLLLLVQTAYCWYCYYAAQFLAYDDNYGLIIQGYLISVFILGLTVWLWFFKRQWIKENKFFVVLWLITGSPLVFTIVSIYYSTFFNLQYPT